MGIENCRECGKPVSTEAKTCPSCGARKPTKTTSKTRWGMIVLVVLAIGILSRGFGNRSGSVTPEPTNQQAHVAQGDSRPECQVKKADGSPGDRVCDLVELCKDRAHWRDKVIGYADSSQYQKGFEATKYLESVNTAIAEFRPEDVSAVCGGTYNAAQAGKLAKPFTNDGSCNESPLVAIPIGQQMNSSELARIVDKICPGALFNSDQTVTIKWEGKQYQVLSSKLPFDGVEARYEVAAIKAK